MNCQEVQLQLSSYLEKSLDAIRMKSIESHLSSCPFCRAELHGLSDCIQLVSSLPMVEPPPGFTQRVMAHAREIEPEPRSWQRFFAAFKITVPVQAAAVVLIGVLAVLLYRKEPQVNDFTFVEQSAPAVPSSQSEQETYTAVENTSVKRHEERDTKAVESAPEPVAKATQQPAPSDSSIKEEAAKPQSAPAPARGPQIAMEKALERRLPAPRRPTIQAQEVSTGSDSARPSVDDLGIGAAIGALSRSPFRASPFSAERALSPLSEPSPDFEFVVKRRPRERADGLRKRSEATAVATSADTSSAAAASSINQVVEIRWFTVAPEHYELFKRDLAAEAMIDSEKAIAAKERDFGLKPPRELLIKVMILPPER